MEYGFFAQKNKDRIDQTFFYFQACLGNNSPNINFWLHLLFYKDTFTETIACGYTDFNVNWKKCGKDVLGTVLRCYSSLLSQVDKDRLGKP